MIDRSVEAIAFTRFMVSPPRRRDHEPCEVETILQDQLRNVAMTRAISASGSGTGSVATDQPDILDSLFQVYATTIHAQDVGDISGLSQVANSYDLKIA